MNFKHPSIVLTTFGLLGTALVAITNYISAPEIAKQEQKQLLKIFEQLVPADLYDNDILSTCRLLTSPQLGSKSAQRVYFAKQGSEVHSIIYNIIAPDGYNGEIKLVAAITPSGEVLAVRALSHNETPGLGDKIDIRKSDWITEFNGKTLSIDSDSLWAVKKDGGQFDAFTGATITPRAIIKAVKHLLLYQQSNIQYFDSTTEQCDKENDGQH